MLGKILCKLGLHRFEREPQSKELIKGTGAHMAFWSEGIQKATKQCTRPECGFVCKIWRKGWLGAGGKAGRWKKLSENQERYIDSLPVL